MERWSISVVTTTTENPYKLVEQLHKVIRELPNKFVKNLCTG